MDANPADGDLPRAVEQLSDEAFELAKDTAGGSPQDATEARARELREVLPQLAAQVRSVEDDGERSRMSHLLSESNLDLRYVVAQGNLPSSVRLHVHLERERLSPG